MDGYSHTELTSCHENRDERESSISLLLILSLQRLCQDTKILEIDREQRAERNRDEGEERENRSEEEKISRLKTGKIFYSDATRHIEKFLFVICSRMFLELREEYF